MSIRALGTRLFRHGQALIRHTARRDFNTVKITDTTNVGVQQPTRTSLQPVTRSFGIRDVGAQLSLHARRLLIDNVLNRVTNSLAAELRKKAARRILFGDSGPFFALVGVSLASGTGILTKEDELEGVCLEIREAVSKIKWTSESLDIDETVFEKQPVTLKDFSLGEPIAKGANAVVYTAKFKEEIPTQERVDNIKYPLALKMMFNYDIQSNSMAILQAMYRETVPARQYYSNREMNDWEAGLSKIKKNLPPHPNIVAMFSVFTDYIPELRDARTLYPAALPARINPEGEGRNMSLFLLMRRYNCSLQEYLSRNDPSPRTRLLLFAQLLEGISHITSQGIAHRDLKSDNLLLDTESLVPILVISDFGCCLANRSTGLILPYTSYEIDKGGNTALMAPEILTQTPGSFSVLNYTKSDLWAAGTLAYEIFGGTNPFYKTSEQVALLSANYKEEELPDLLEVVPVLIRNLVKNILQRNPRKRLDPNIATNVCQLYLWAPSNWLKPENIKLPASTEILQWLLSLSTKVLCESRLNADSVLNDGNVYRNSRRTYPEYLLISSFLSRVRLSQVRSALSWIQSNNL